MADQSAVSAGKARVGSQNIIQIADLKKIYQLGKTSVEALRGVNFSVAEGEFTVVLGPSGSGKTTLLNIIGCLDRATSGQYLLDGEDVSNRDFNDLAEVRNFKIGFIFQNFNLIPVLNVIENIEFPCLVRDKREERAKLRERVRAVCAEVGLERFMTHKPDELSGGQRQRVAIARALITEPRLVLADEPTANLDSKTSDQILELMQRLNREHSTTFLFATHDPRVMELARRTVRIKDGLVVPD
ncbi:MAG: ABC transporter ATP-binding protein [Proteobacteria bacterium]|nr:ABC transporter ATP-binding protein [Pseudomonadota bacterium]